MYGETGYHGAYAAGQTEVGNGMHRSPSASKCTSLKLKCVLLHQSIGAADHCRCRQSPSMIAYFSCLLHSTHTQLAYAGLYQGKFGQASYNTSDEQHTSDESNSSHGMPATHTDAESCAYQGRFGTTPEAKLFEPQYSGELERKGSAYHGRLGQ